MKITVLVHLENAKPKASYDVVADQVKEALEKGGHKASILAVHADVKKLVAGLARQKPDLVFNLMETFGTGNLGDVGVAGLLDLLGMHYTGGGPGELYLPQDKALTKKLLAFDKLLYPDFAVFSRNADLETGGNLRMPLFVKPLRMDASIGIDAKAALVRDSKDMMERVLMIHKKLGDSALVEEYIEGREFYVGIVGNQEPLALPPIEVDFSKLPDGAPHVLDAKAKWDEKSAEFKGTKSKVAHDLPDELRAKLHKVSLGAYRAARVRDYGRIDLRMTEAGEIYVLEINPSCYLDQASEFAVAAAAAEVDYPTLIQRIVDAAVKRYEADGQ